MGKHPVPFSWRALLLAPLVISVPAALLLVGGSRYPVVAFGLGALLGYIIALSVEGCLFLPLLWLMGRVAPIRPWMPPAIGGLLAAPIFLAWDYTSWSSSGVDSGPPTATFRQWIAKSWFTPEPLVVISIGVITAAVYRFLATRRPNQSSQRPPAVGRGR